MSSFSSGVGLLGALLLLALAIRRGVGRHKLERIIFEADTLAGKRFDLALLISIVLSVLLVALESDPQLRGQYKAVFQPLEVLFSSLFSLEYLLRLLCSRQPWPYARSFFGLVDLVSSLPPLLTLGIPAGQSLLVARVLRLLRVFRILKLGSYLDEAQLLRQALVASRRKISVFLLTIVALVVLIGTLMYVIEGERSGFTSIPVGIYWAVVTITTVGYGDVAPVTTLGRFVASLVMLLGYSIIAVPTGIVTASINEAQREQRRAPETRHQAEPCPHCGRPLPHG
ncbi:ion transporter [Vulcanococcus sp. Clear-D1]|uniref:ion transporter n=1 Tax=Vulcanococcus sp. Clear-D1 TaxID=2766970 RepID=UPI0019B3BBEE|nr:ion transporter [Vulcanococcus sp. Clear-D1]MBD1195530.1 ion transporter [Vulcanococcus sp. Clear-D1]